MVIRFASLPDVEELRTLSELAFRNAYSWYNTPENMEFYVRNHFTEEKLAEEISDPSFVYLLAFENNELAGYAKLDLKTTIKTAAKKPLEIARLYTKPELIGKGVGKKLVREVDRFAVENGFDSVCLSAWQKNEKAVKFYQREGFVIGGTLKFLFGTDLQDDFLMIKVY